MLAIPMTTTVAIPVTDYSYVGLSGGFVTVTVGKVWGAAYNHFGAIVDQVNWYGSTGTIEDIAGGKYFQFADAVSYAVSIGNVSLQAMPSWAKTRVRPETHSISVRHSVV